MSTITDPRAWQQQLWHARHLDDAELKRHALVSTRNKHQCQGCFTCACEAVRKERLANRSLPKQRHFNPNTGSNQP